jgi:hypothetical protein
MATVRMPSSVGGTHHANGDFTAIRDEQALDRPRLGEWIHLRMMIALRRLSDQRKSREMFGLAIHGGAGTLPRTEMGAELERQYRAGLERGARAGFAVLEAGGTSLDAVTRAVVVLEDNPLFNAGRGAVFTLDGHNELDASIMDGATLGAGAVCGLTHIKNPIELARTVMEHSEYVMLERDGAEEFALQAAASSWCRELLLHRRALEASSSAFARRRAGSRRSPSPTWAPWAPSRWTRAAAWPPPPRPAA